MTTHIRTKVGGDSVIEVNGVAAVVIGSAGIKSGVAPAVITPAMLTADAQPAGLGQTVQSFTVGAQRLINVTYTNSSGRQIEVTVNHSGQSNGSTTILVGGQRKVDLGMLTGSGGSICTSVPPGATYLVTVNGNVPAPTVWLEQRV